MTLQQSAQNLLEQLKFVCSTLQPSHFSQPIPELSGASIGQHVRHTLEFFICLIDGRNGEAINYDNRKHDEFISEDVQLAISVIATIQEFLQDEQNDFDLKLEVSYAQSELEEDQHHINSSFNRELAYNIEHAIHHMALIKVGVIQHFQYLQLPEHFGVASSTVRYQQERRA